MASRIEIELTSRRDDDGTVTWRAAGAREPKGVASLQLFPDGASVGDTFRVDADIELDGITITYVHPPKAKSKDRRDDVLQLIPRDEGPLVTSHLAPGSRSREDRGRRDRPRDDRPRDDRPRSERGPREGGGREREGRGRGGPERGREGGGRDGGREGGSREGAGRERRGPRTPAKPKLPPKPKAPRLSAGRVHRDAFLESLSSEQRPIADQLLKGGLQGVRRAVDKQNEENKAAGRPEVGAELLAEAEKLLPMVRVAEWRDRADAALAAAEVVDLRDLRSVVTAADGTARDDESRQVAAQLRDALAARLESEQAAWIAEIVEMLDDDRAVRALHLSSRPPKAGAPLPADVAQRLVAAANASLTAETSQDRWGYVLEALAHSPVRKQVVPASLPANVGPELTATIARLGDRLPDIAAIFDITPDPKAARPARPKRPAKAARPEGKDKDKDKGKAESAKAEADADAPVAEEAAAEEHAAAVDAPVTEEPAAEESAAAVDAPVTEEPAAEEPAAAVDAPVTEEPVTEEPAAEEPAAAAAPAAEATDQDAG